ncbi:hypothetical protein QL285_061722 [Trifolium repens]|nr:hypothetical protein QL285_061722 [Trifolium repens]
MQKKLMSEKYNLQSTKLAFCLIDKKGPDQSSSMKAKPITNINNKKISITGKMTSYPNKSKDGAISKNMKSSFMQMVAQQTSPKIGEEKYDLRCGKRILWQ